MVLGFVHAILAARLLGPEGYGVVAVALSVTAVAAAFAMLGFGPLAVREVAQLVVRADWSSLRGFLRFSGLVVVGVSIVVAGALAALSVWTDLFGASYRTEIAIATLMILPLGILQHIRGVCQGFGRVLAALLPAEFLRPAMLVGGLGLLLVFNPSATTVDYMWLSVGTAFLALVLAAFLLAKLVRTLVPVASMTFKPNAWSRSAVPFSIIFLLGAIGTQANTLLLGWLAGPTEAGLFQPIMRLTPIMLMVTEAIAMPLAPRLASCWEQRDLEGIRHLYRLATPVATVGTLIIVIGMVLVAPILLSAFGREFLANQHLLLWIGLAQIASASTGAATLLLIMAGKMRIRIALQCITLLVQLGLGLVLIGPYGADGAAIALIGSILVWSVLHWFFARFALNVETSLLAMRRS